MPIHAFLARPFDHTHENEVFDLFLERLEARWGQTNEEVVVIGNPIWNGCDPDCVVLKRNAITIIDFKNFGGTITVQENGPWKSASGPVKGGSKANPFHQIRDNKYALKEWFEGQFPQLQQDFRHITGLVVFHKPVKVEGELSQKVQTWFKVCDLDHAADTLGYFASKGINLDRDTLLGIPGQIGVEPHSPAWKRFSVERLQGPSTLSSPLDRQDWKQGQQEAIKELRGFFSTPEKTIFRLLGMCSTGKTALLPAIEALAQGLGRPLVYLAPNGRLATTLSRKTGQGFESLYSHIFDASVKAVRSEVTEKGHKKVSVHPFREDKDADDCVYVIEEAHLLGNSYFEVEGERFGTGRLWDDFLAFSKLGSISRKVILLGDPYQLHRGGKADMPIHGELLVTKGHSADAYELEQVIVEDDRKTLTGNAITLVEAIRTQRFNRLPLDFSDAFQAVPDGDNLAFTRGQFQKDVRGCLVVLYSNKAASQLNARLREVLFDTQGRPLVPGDRVELYSPVRLEETLEESHLFGTGTLALATTPAQRIETKGQILKGRDKAIQWREGHVGLQLDEESTRIPDLSFLVDFLEAEKPELDADRVVALKVHYRESEEGAPVTAKLPPTRLRYAYATTCHHAQGTNRPTILINTNTGQGQNNEEYFRWLYTAITRAEHHVLLLNYTPLTPFLEARWSEAGVRVVKDIRGGLTLQIDPTAIPSDEDLAREQPQWSGNPTPAQLWFWLETTKCLENAGWAIPKVTSHPYQEHYDLVGPDGESCTIALSYTKDNAVTGIRALRGNGTAVPLALIGLRSSEIILKDPRGQGALDELKTRLTATGWVIEQVGESNYLLAIRIAKGGTEKAKLDVHFGGDGMVSSVRAVEVTNEELLAPLHQLICPDLSECHG